ncbi:MAG: Trm112 family protein [Nitrospira sp.]|nr:Trm112 family protein [Candidatus Manganitrophaceae bacterium]HIL35535.1 Trm112 family protein [Candidatus Manganitrophaceae bacterium]
MSIGRDLLDILACPKCKGEIHLNEKEDGILCVSCGLMYPIRNDIPVMLIDEAVKVEGPPG